MLILLPPSEGKASPTRGKVLDLDSISFPELTPARAKLIDELVELCEGPVERAVQVLGLGPSQAAEIRRNAALRTAPTVRADRLYAGVLYDALGLPDLEGAAKARATRWLVISSALFGAVRPTDRLPAYRISGSVTLPGLGGIAAHWRSHLGEAMESAAGNGLLIDLRSSTYAAFWRPPAGLASRVATVRVLHEANGRRSIVSHFNKATKGRLVRALLEDGGTPRNPGELTTQLRDLGWQVEPQEPAKTGQQLDVVITQL